MKRLFDLLVSIILAPIALLVCSIVSVIYYLSERESPIFVQRRVGLNEVEFAIYKMRTMRASTESVGTHEVDSSSVTKVGKVLRASKLDELPQLFNVIVGDMSLVGPRPCLVSQTELRDERRKAGVFEVRPGVTGLSQIRGIDMSNPMLLAKTDANYIKGWSFKSDIQILISTVLGAGSGDRVR